MDNRVFNTVLEPYFKSDGSKFYTVIGYNRDGKQVRSFTHTDKATVIRTGVEWKRRDAR